MRGSACPSNRRRRRRVDSAESSTNLRCRDLYYPYRRDIMAQSQAAVRRLLSGAAPQELGLVLKAIRGINADACTDSVVKEAMREYDNDDALEFVAAVT